MSQGKCVRKGKCVFRWLKASLTGQRFNPILFLSCHHTPPSRPNCVIIDEIDGATGGAEGVSAISALLRIVNAGTGDGNKRHGGAPARMG